MILAVVGNEQTCNSIVPVLDGIDGVQLTEGNVHDTSVNRADVWVLGEEFLPVARKLHRPIILATSSAHHSMGLAMLADGIVQEVVSIDAPIALRARVRAFLARLERAQATIDRRTMCFRLIAHDLNNPLTAIRILSEMLRDDAEDPEAKKDLSDILQAADLTGALVEGMSQVVRLESPEDEYTWARLDLATLVSAACGRPAFRDHTQLELNGPLTVMGDSNALAAALVDVLLHSRRLAENRGKIHVTGQVDAGLIRLRFDHQGVRVPPELRGLLLQRYGVAPIRDKRIPVSATGLTSAMRVIERHSGQLRFVPEATSAVVEITLPERLPPI